MKTIDRVYFFLKDFREDKGYYPTIREIQKGLNIGSSSTVHRQLKNLEKLGYITMEPGIFRSIQVKVVGK